MHVDGGVHGALPESIGHPCGMKHGLGGPNDSVICSLGDTVLHWHVGGRKLAFDAALCKPLDEGGGEEFPPTVGAGGLETVSEGVHDKGVEVLESVEGLVLRS